MNFTFSSNQYFKIRLNRIILLVFTVFLINIPQAQAQAKSDITEIPCMIYPYSGEASIFIKSKGTRGKIRYGHGILSDGLKLYSISCGSDNKEILFSSPVLDGHGVLGKINMFVHQETGDEYFCQLAETIKNSDLAIDGQLRFAIGRYTGIDGKKEPVYYGLFSYSSDSRCLALFDATSYNRLVNQIYRTESDNVINLSRTKMSILDLHRILICQHIFVVVAGFANETPGH